MADLDKHLNLVYSGTTPLNLGDRYYAQDLIRDLNYSWDVTGQAVKRTLGTFPALLQGGIVTMGAGDTLNITEAWGVCSYDVEVPNTFAALPPSKMTVTIARMVHAAAQTNLAMASATKDGATPNYIKLAYTEIDGNARTRARASGSYSYERVPSYTYSITAAAPTDYEISLGTVIIAAGGAGPWTLSLSNPYNIKKVYDDLDVIERIYGTSTETVTAATRIILDTDIIHIFFADPSARAITITLPTLAENLYKIYTIKVISTGGWVKLAGEGAETIDGIASFIMYTLGDNITVIGQTGGWKILTGHATYSTGWINTADWTNRHLGSMQVVTKTSDSSAYTIGELLTEETTGNTFRLDACTGGVGGTFTVRSISGTGFATADKKLTGSTSGINTIQVNGTTKNQDNNVIHNFLIAHPYLTTTLWGSPNTTGTDASAKQLESKPGAGGVYGWEAQSASTSVFIIQTGTDGFLVYDAAGAVTQWAANDYSYKCLVEYNK